MKVLFAVLSLLKTLQEFIYSLPVLGPIIEYFSSLCASSVRLFVGSSLAQGATQPRRNIILYEYEACPFCRKVREAIAVLGIDVEVRPIPRETLSSYGFCSESRFRPEVQKHVGTIIAPVLVKEDGTAMKNSDDIIEYLWETYGKGVTAPLSYRLVTGVLKPTLFLAGIFRLSPKLGLLRTPSKKPGQPLEFWQTECGPSSRIAREALCSLELPYILHPSPAGSVSQQQLVKKGGSVPFLYDPNTEKKMSGGFAIRRYLNKQYQIGETVSADFTSYSTAGATADHGTIGAKSKAA